MREHGCPIVCLSTNSADTGSILFSGIRPFFCCCCCMFVCVCVRVGLPHTPDLCRSPPPFLGFFVCLCRLLIPPSAPSCPLRRYISLNQPRCACVVLGDKATPDGSAAPVSRRLQRFYCYVNTVGWTSHTVLVVFPHSLLMLSSAMEDNFDWVPTVRWKQVCWVNSSLAPVMSLLDYYQIVLLPEQRSSWPKLQCYNLASRSNS